MPALKFCANLSFMFKETPNLLERYQMARDVGFKAVEYAFPYDFSIDDVVAAKKKADVEQILINSYVGDVTKGEFGFAALPGCETYFENSIKRTVDYAKALQCERVHVMSGNIVVGKAQESNDLAYLKSMKHAAEVFERENIVGLIEPINPFTVPTYYLNNYDKALNVIQKIQSPHLKLMLDVFHMQQICGNLAHNITEMMKYIGHIQIAQVPGRNEPNVSGEIDFKFIFSLLERLGYDGWIGLEYAPKDGTVKGLQWIKEFGIRL